MIQSMPLLFDMQPNASSPHLQIIGSHWQLVSVRGFSLPSQPAFVSQMEVLALLWLIGINCQNLGFFVSFSLELIWQAL